MLRNGQLGQIDLVTRKCIREETRLRLRYLARLGAVFELVFDAANQFHGRRVWRLLHRERDTPKTGPEDVPKKLGLERAVLISLHGFEENRWRRILLGHQIANRAHLFLAADRLLYADQISHFFDPLEPIAEILDCRSSGRCYAFLWFSHFYSLLLGPSFSGSFMQLQFATFGQQRFEISKSIV
jgi:hypothetical protein